MHRSKNTNNFRTGPGRRSRTLILWIFSIVVLVAGLVLIEKFLRDRGSSISRIFHKLTDRREGRAGNLGTIKSAADIYYGNQEANWPTTSVIPGSELSKLPHWKTFGECKFEEVVITDQIALDKKWKLIPAWPGEKKSVPKIDFKKYAVVFISLGWWKNQRNKFSFNRIETYLDRTVIKYEEEIHGTKSSGDKSTKSGGSFGICPGFIQVIPSPENFPVFFERKVIEHP